MVFFIAIALIFDLKEHRIPNLLNAIFIITGFGYNTINFGASGLLISIKGFSMGLILILILYIIDAVGAGDVKLFAGLGALMGSYFVLYLIVVTIFLTGIFALVFFLIKNWKSMSRTKGEFIAMQLISKKIFNRNLKGNINRTYFPLMIFVAPSVLIVIAILYY